MNDYIEIRLEGGEFALPVEIGASMEDKKNRGWWPATRQGEPPTRKCERCGKTYTTGNTGPKNFRRDPEKTARAIAQAVDVWNKRNQPEQNLFTIGGEQ